MENSENSTKQPDPTQETQKTQAHRKGSSTTFTVRIDWDSYDRLETESETRNIPLSTYATSMIKECWDLRSKNTEPRTENTADDLDADKEGVFLSKTRASLKKEAFAASWEQGEALKYLRKRFETYTDEQLISAALMNVAENEAAFLFLTDYTTTLKKVSYG